MSKGRAANFTTGTDSAVKFGVHEIVLNGDGSADTVHEFISIRGVGTASTASG